MTTTLSEITPNALWLAHREAAGGKSTITGAPLPDLLDDCAAGPQATHYAMACFIAEIHGDDGEVPAPNKLLPDQAEKLEHDARELARKLSGREALPGVRAERS